MAKQTGTGGGGIDGMEAMILGAMVLIMLWAVWKVGHTKISTAYAWVRVIELSPWWVMHQVFLLANRDWWIYGAGTGIVFGFPLAAYVHQRAKKGRTWVMPAALGGASALVLIAGHEIGYGWFIFFLESDKKLMEPSHLMWSSLMLNLFLLVVLIAPVAIAVYRHSAKNNPYNEFNYGKPKPYTLASFSRSMEMQYPHVELFRRINLTPRPLDSGQYRMSETEKQFALNHMLLVYVRPGVLAVDVEMAREVFRRELGRRWMCEDRNKPWQGFSSLTVFELAVLAVVLPRVAATDSKMSAEEYEDAMASTQGLLAGYWRDAVRTLELGVHGGYDRVEIDIGPAKALLSKFYKHRYVLDLFSRHFYVNTIIYEALVQARALGVLPAAELRWLRVADRALWMLIDTVGRQTPFSETSGTFNHWLVEHKRKRGCERPALDAAVKGLQEAVNGMLFTADEAALAASQIRMREEAAQQAVDPAVLARRKQHLLLAVVSSQDDKPVPLELAVMDATNGRVIAQWAGVRDGGLSAEDCVALEIEDGSQWAASAESERELLELTLKEVSDCTVHVVSESVLGLLPGMERSAFKVIRLSDSPQLRGAENVNDMLSTLGLEPGARPAGRLTATDMLGDMRQVYLSLERSRLESTLAK